MSQPQQRISQIREILHTLAAAYPRFELTKEREAVYITYLSDIPLEELRAASIAYITNSASGQWFPSVSQLRALVGAHRRQASGLPTAEEAWAEVNRAWDGEKHRLTGEKSESGAWIMTAEIFAWSHPLVEQIARDLGWPRGFPGENVEADRAHWLKVYERRAAEATREAVEHPAVTKFIQQQGETARLDVGQQIKQLAGKLQEKR